MNNEKDNPFYNNYVFKPEDIKRAKIKWYDYPFLWLLPTFVQIVGRYAFHFKQDKRGRIFLMKVEEL